MMGRLLLAALLLAALPASAAGASPAAGADAFHLTADAVDYLPGGVMVARGHVSVAGSGVTVTGDELTYDRARESVTLRGNVVMKEGERGAFTGETLTLSLLTLLGGMTDGAITVAGTRLTLRGKRITRIGPDQIEVDEGTFSTCPEGVCQDWSFRARRIRVEKEGYLTATGSAFYIDGIPVFYSPWLIFPVKTGRQAGLLIPEFGYSSRNGVETAFPVFVPLGGAADLTFTPRAFSLAPDGGELEARYRAPRGGGGEWSGFALGGKGSGDQWFARGFHALEAAPGVWTRARWYGAGDPAAPGRFARLDEERDPGAALSLAAVEGGWGPLSVWSGSSRLFTDARDWSRARGLERLRTGVSLEGLRLGPLGLGVEGEQVRFGRDGSGGGRRTVTPSADLDLPRLGPLRGDLSASWTRCLDDLDGLGDGPGVGANGRFELVALREQMALKREIAPGVRHRLDLALTAARATASAFAGTVRDGEDGSRPAALLSYEVSTQVAGSGFSVLTRGGAWRDGETGESQGFINAGLALGGFTLALALNPDGELAAVLPNPGIARPQGRGWEATAKLAGAAGEVELDRQRQGGTDSVRGSFRLPLARWELSGTADFDLAASRMSESGGGVLYRGPCWVAGVSYMDRISGSAWRASFSLTP
jgi:hypothetical protein